MFMNPSIRSLTVPALLLAGLALGAILLIGPSTDVQAQERQERAAPPAMKVGIYDQQALFEQYPGSQELMQFYQRVQQQMQEAVQNGDQQRIQQLQQSAEQKQKEVVDAFHEAVEEALPKVANEANVKVVALQVVYTADSVQETNLTRPLAAALNQE